MAPPAGAEAAAAPERAHHSGVGERPGGRACTRTDVLRVGQQLDLAAVDQAQQLVPDVARTLHAAHLQAEAGCEAGRGGAEKGGEGAAAGVQGWQVLVGTPPVG